MKLKACFYSLLFIPFLLTAQYEQKISLTISAEFGILITQRWSYFGSGNTNYLYWSIHDSITNIPQFGVIQNVGDVGGDFVFIRQ